MDWAGSRRLPASATSSAGSAPPVGLWGDPTSLTTGDGSEGLTAEDHDQDDDEDDDEDEDDAELDDGDAPSTAPRRPTTASSSPPKSTTSSSSTIHRPPRGSTASSSSSSSSSTTATSPSSSSSVAPGGVGGTFVVPAQLPQVVEVEYEQSFGFVEVGEGELAGGGYKLQRNPSTVLLTGDGLAAQQRQLEEMRQAVEDLRVELARLKDRVTEFEEENHEWSLRYSRRMAVVANASLGLWIFWSRFILFVKRHKADLIQGWLRSSSSSSSTRAGGGPTAYYSPSAVAGRAAAPLLARSKNSLVRHAIIGAGGGRTSRRASFNKLFTEGYLFAIRHSWIFILSSYLINKKGFRRWLGLIASTCYSVYLAFFTDTVPWTSYFTIFANLLYITACLKGINDSEKEVPSLFTLHKGSNPSSRGPTMSPVMPTHAAASVAGSHGSNGTATVVSAMHRNGSFGSPHHARSLSRGSRKVTPLSTFAASSPTPSFSSGTTAGPSTSLHPGST